MSAAGLDFAPDSALLADEDSVHSVMRLDPASGRRFATLTSPQRLMPITIEFSPDGRFLALNTHTETIEFWDLQRIREKLAAMNLDWTP